MAGERQLLDLIRDPGVAERLFRSYAMNGDLPRAIDATFSPVLLVDDLTADPEYRWTRGRQVRYSQVAGIGASVGNFSLITFKQITNTPLNRVTVLEKIIIRAGAAAVGVYAGIILAQTIAGVTYTGLLQAPHDDRMPAVTGAGPTTFGASHMGTGVNAARPTGSDSSVLVTVPANDTFVWDNPGFVFTGRNMLVFSGELVNTGFVVSLVWRERELQPGEIT